MQQAVATITKMFIQLENTKIFLSDNELEKIRQFIFNKELYNNKTYSLHQEKTTGLLQIIKQSYLKVDASEAETIIKNAQFAIEIFHFEIRRIEDVYHFIMTLSEDTSYKIIKAFLSSATYLVQTQIQPQKATEYLADKSSKHLNPAKITSAALTPPTEVQAHPQKVTEYPVRRLPKKLYPIKTTLSVPELFLCSNLEEDDNFHIPLTSTESKRLLDSLNAGDYKLLEDYFQRGIHPGPLISDLYFRQKNDQVSLDLFDMVHAIADAVSELTHDPKPGNKITIFPIFSDDGNFSYETEKRLLSYLKNNYPIEEQLPPELKAKFHSIPVNERFFSVVELSDEYFFMALKAVIESCFSYNDRTLFQRIYFAAPLLRAQLNPYRDRLNHLISKIDTWWQDNKFYLETELSISETHTILKEVYDNLLTDIPSLKYYTQENYFYAQLISNLLSMCAPVVSLNRGRQSAGHLVIPGKILEMCNSFFYGEISHVRRFIGFAKFSATNVALATKRNGRIINGNWQGISSVKSTHGSKKAGPWSVRTHDLAHWHKMFSIPIDIRHCFIAWAKMIAKETGFKLSKITYLLYDMDFEFISCYVGNPKRTSATTNIDFVLNSYKRIIKVYPQLRAQIFEYTLIIIIGMLKNPSLTTRTFSHCTELNSDEHFAITSQIIIANLFHSVSDPEDKKISENFLVFKKIFDNDCSSTHNIFCYLTTQAVLNKKLEDGEQKLLTSLLKKVNVLKWTRNHGLKLSHNDMELYVVDIKSENLDLVLNIILSATNHTDKNNYLKEITEVLPNFKEKAQTENPQASQKETCSSKKISDQNVYKSFATLKMGWFIVPKERLLLYQDLTRKKIGTAEDRLPKPRSIF